MMRVSSQSEQLGALLDTLLPGGDGFPAASTTPTLQLLQERWPMKYPAPTPDLAAILLLVSETASLTDMPDADRIAAVGSFHSRYPDLFAAFCRVVYLSYYQCGAVVAAVAAAGHQYHDTPLPTGYAVAPYDPAADAPRHARGTYLATGAVVAVDCSALSHLDDLRKAHSA